jgi:hypothetical protein
MFEALENPQQRAFLAAYSTLGNVTKAAAIAGISRETAYQWKRTDREYRKAWKQARTMAGGALEDEAVTRAKEGYEEYVLYKGDVVLAPLAPGEPEGAPRQPLMRRKVSDKLLGQLLGGLLKRDYARQHEHQHRGKIKVKVEAKPDLSKLSSEELDALEKLARKIRE